MKKLIDFMFREIFTVKFIKFAITGVLNTIVDFAVYTLCNEIFLLRAELSQFFAYTTATVNSYGINKYWTFQKKRRSMNEFAKFVIINLISLSITITGINILHERLGINRYVCKIPIACITVCINYFGSKIYVFK